jgi:hypothetical protein
MVTKGISPGEIDAMDIGDVVSWFEILVHYQKEVDKVTPKEP